MPNGVDTERHAIAEGAEDNQVGAALDRTRPTSQHTSNSAWPYDLYVHPEARRKGYGTAITRAIKPVAGERCTSVSTWKVRILPLPPPACRPGIQQCRHRMPACHSTSTAPEI
ncbi:GNAT family N-acetyltransferase [Rhodococcus opacus]|uniref:GNAT family N-acetyltransferase n=1 Tax=Rhodococcus opacus TaxID=37919 RepID=UPI0038642239